MKIQQFDGGLSTRKKPQFIGQNQGVVYENIDNSKGSLISVKSSEKTDIAVSPYQYYYDSGDEWISSSNRRFYVQYEGDLYWTDGTNTPQIYNGTAKNLGIANPEAIDADTASVVEVDHVINLTFNVSDTGSLPRETLHYAVFNDNGANISNVDYFTVSPSEVTVTIENDFVPLNPVRRYRAGRSDESRFTIETSDTMNVTIKNPKGITIGSDGVRVFRLYEGTYRYVNRLTTSSSSFVDNTLDISANSDMADYDYGELQSLQGVYQYQMTYYNSVDGFESGPGPISGDVGAVQGSSGVTLSNLSVSSDPQVDKKRIYRTGGNVTQPTLLAEIDNADTSYVDELGDTELLGTILETADAQPAPDDLNYIIEAYAMLFAAQGYKLRFTPIGKPTQWPSLYFLQFSELITGLAEVSNGILVFSKFKTYLVTGSGPQSLSEYPLSNEQGCLTAASIQVINNTALWVSSDGVCISDGSTVEVLSKDPLGKQSLTITDSAIYDRNYYALKSDGDMLVWDFEFGRIFKSLSLGNETIVAGNDKLYGRHSDGFLYELFASTDDATLKYKSPRFIEGQTTADKTYKKLRLFYEGAFTVTIYINDELVSTHALSGKGNASVSVPQPKQRGNYIQIEIEGTGEVFEYEYLVGRPKNA